MPRGVPSTPRTKPPARGDALLEQNRRWKEAIDGLLNVAGIEQDMRVLASTIDHHTRAVVGGLSLLGENGSNIFILLAVMQQNLVLCDMSRTLRRIEGELKLSKER